MKIIIILFIILIFLGIWEKRRYKNNRKKIKTCIYVNGTRGKSSTTRLIAAGLRQAGFKTMAKTTGTTARIIYPDGNEEAIKRRGIPRIIEQMHMINKAANNDVDILVVECMAISPEMQWVSEHEIMKTDIGIITNVRFDHEDKMGNTLKEIAETLALTIPEKGTLLTAEENNFSVLARKAAELDSEIRKVNYTEIDKINLSKFFYPAYKENVNLAIKTCELLNVDTSTALEGMYNSQPDPGALFMKKIIWENNNYYLVNAFAANDLISTRMSWEKWQKCYNNKYPEEIKIVGLFNNRADRLSRIHKLASFCKEQSDLEKILLLGKGKILAKNILLKKGMQNDQIEIFHSSKPKDILTRLDNLYNEDLLLFGFGNTKGIGEEIIKLFLARGEDIT